MTAARPRKKQGADTCRRRFPLCKEWQTNTHQVGWFVVKAIKQTRKLTLYAVLGPGHRLIYVTEVHETCQVFGPVHHLWKRRVFARHGICGEEGRAEKIDTLVNSSVQQRTCSLLASLLALTPTGTTSTTGWSRTDVTHLCSSSYIQPAADKVFMTLLP
jgi:hypothetical protein